VRHSGREPDRAMRRDEPGRVVRVEVHDDTRQR
jgi:hypothetical protein